MDNQPAEAVKLYMKIIREKLGITGGIVHFPTFKYYTNAEGEFFSVEANGVEFNAYGQDRVKVTQSVREWRDLPNLGHMLREISQSIRQEDSRTAEEKRKGEIKDLEKRLEDLKKRK